MTLYSRQTKMVGHLSIVEGLGKPHRSLWSWSGTSKTKISPEIDLLLCQPDISYGCPWGGCVMLGGEYGHSECRQFPKRADNWGLSAGSTPSIRGNKSFIPEWDLDSYSQHPLHQVLCMSWPFSFSSYSPFLESFPIQIPDSENLTWPGPNHRSLTIWRLAPLVRSATVANRIIQSK